MSAEGVFPFAKALRMALEGEIMDSTSVLALVLRGPGCGERWA
jgi:hypothetical protein